MNTGTIISKALMDTLLGMGTVFAVLIFISLIISLFRYLPQLEDRWKALKTKRQPPLITEKPEEKREEKQLPADVPDAQTLAVIMAVIRQYVEDNNTAVGEFFDDTYVVRSIRRR
jgi:Na+-transporting methylmalonyl-CoA/oxaloacetate decarboxylase, gamma subunit